MYIIFITGYNKKCDSHSTDTPVIYINCKELSIILTTNSIILKRPCKNTLQGLLDFLFDYIYLFHISFKFSLTL